VRLRRPVLCRMDGSFGDSCGKCGRPDDHVENEPGHEYLQRQQLQRSAGHRQPGWKRNHFCVARNGRNQCIGSMGREQRQRRVPGVRHEFPLCAQPCRRHAGEHPYAGK